MFNLQTGKYLGVSALCMMAGVSVSFADIALKYDTGDASAMVMYVTDGRVAMVMDMGSQGEGRMIYDAASDKILMVSDSRREYMDMDEMVQAMGGLSDMLAGAMAGLDDETKSQLGGLLGGLGGQKEPPPEATMRDTGRDEAVLGIDCDVVEIVDASGTFEMCLADHGDVGVSDKDFRLMKAMFSKQQSMANQMSQMFGNQQSFSFSSMDLDRVPVKMEPVNVPGDASKLISISETVDSSMVNVPDSYAKASAPGG